MIDCTLARKLMNGYIDGTLTDDDSFKFEEHISCCEKCHEEYDMIKAMSYDLAKMKTPLPEDFGRKIHVALVNEQFKMGDKKERKIPFAAYTRFATATAAALVIAVAGKFGVYDVYKNVMEDSSTALTEIQAVQPDDEIITEGEPVHGYTSKQPVTDTAVVVTETKKTTPVNTENKKTYNPPVQEVEKTIEQDVVQTEPPVDTVVEDIVVPETFAFARVAEEPVQTEENTVADEAAPVSSGGGTAIAENEGTVIPEDKGMQLEEVLMDESTKPFAEDTEENEVFLNDTEPKKTEQPINSQTEENAEESAKTTSEPKIAVPAIVTIQRYGDGSMIMFKKYLYTFLDGSEIAENDDEIIVTVSAEEYESVLDKISRNEYVKSVFVGTAGEDSAVINIRLSE